MARKDKARYEIEKTMYNGPWKVVASTKRMKKDGMYVAKSFSLLEHAIQYLLFTHIMAFQYPHQNDPHQHFYHFLTPNGQKSSN